ncbi:hypothetical protein T4B_943 [Trichinella pseudospiralis]|uniref:Uncharacterized protein n=1 Tax=Trichinella pseudospiralis TaxID=6337 RepID=A0A0V1EQP3_TRIPS|nr:hypothetical protein T4E_1210 [Trichinella pseudospiralis]KRY76080.1 hypothetical protein T4A_14227 [Trichinella pseudospiralis]KRZ04850.1 hypothetical protein T4B_943 [Trichinella pseudospiralis]KRZ35595.1 hypothetical protein T4C_8729 [Trichinella pseudospiralis]
MLLIGVCFDAKIVVVVIGEFDINPCEAGKILRSMYGDDVVLNCDSKQLMKMLIDGASRLIE